MISYAGDARAKTTSGYNMSAYMKYEEQKIFLHYNVNKINRRKNITDKGQYLQH